MRYELWLSLRFLFTKRRERFISVSAFLSIAGMALGVTALIVVLAVMTGFDHDIKEKLVSINSHIIVDTPYGIEESDELLRKLSATEHVVGVSPFVSGQGILRLPDQAVGVLVRGIDPERESRVSRLAEYVVIGRMPTNEREAVIGTELSQLIQAGLGDTLELISPADGKPHEFIVSGLFHAGMYEYDAYLIGMPLARAQHFFKLEGIVSGVGVRLDDLENAIDMKETLQDLVGPSYTVKTWMDQNEALFGALRVEKIVMFVILSLIVVVAALNIISTLIMIVMEKTREIGILRALGATRSSIARIFLLQGCVIGGSGIALGLAGGLALARNLNGLVDWIEQAFGVALFPSTIYYLDHIPTQINSPDIAWITVIAFLLAVGAATYAAVRAARLIPIEALRYE